MEDLESEASLGCIESLSQSGLYIKTLPPANQNEQTNKMCHQTPLWQLQQATGWEPANEILLA